MSRPTCLTCGVKLYGASGTHARGFCDLDCEDANVRTLWRNARAVAPDYDPATHVPASVIATPLTTWYEPHVGDYGASPDVSEHD